MTIVKGPSLSKEITALVQHVELNQAGWWEKSVQRLVLAAVWLSDHSPNSEEILRTVKEVFSLPLSNGKFMATLNTLEKQDFLVKLTDGTYRIPDVQRKVFEQEITAAEKIEKDAIDYFTSLVELSCKGLDPANVWKVFESEFLVPLINEVGSNAYHLIAGEKMVVDKGFVDRFLKKFDSSYDRALRDLVTSFLDPKKEEVRSHISRLLHARFCVEASGLTEEVINKINETVGKQIQYRIFVDTNFLFSLLNLHDNPSNDAAKELQELITHLQSNLKVKLYIIPRTIDEAKSSIESAKHNLSGIPDGENFTNAALDVGFSGMSKRFLNERLRRGVALSSEDWFDPYLKDFVSIARGNGIEFFNEDLAEYSIRQDVVDDILAVQDSEKWRPINKRKSYEKVAHDMILWHFAKDQRPSHIESPIDARDWILTVDFRLIGFDQHKQERAGENVPLCLHPTSLIQLLQFWVPRTKEFEEAMLGSMRLPFLFQAFDVEAERTSLKILKGLGRFEGREDIPTQTITRVILNEGLRSRLKSNHSVEVEDELFLIRDALIGEMKAQAETEAFKAKQLQNTVIKREEDLSALSLEKKAKEEEVERLKARVTEEENRAKAADAKLIAEGAKIAELKSDLRGLKDTHDLSRARFIYFGLMLILILVAVFAAAAVAALVPGIASIAGQSLFKIFTGVIVFIIGHLFLEVWASRKSQMMEKLLPFKLTRKFRKWLWGVVVFGLVSGVSINLYSSDIQKKLDDRMQKNSFQKEISTNDSVVPQK
jgi:hypothetical protein